MYVITKLNINTLKTEIIKLIGKKDDAITHLYKHLEKLEKNEEVVLQKSSETNVVNVYTRMYGYFHNSKELVARYEILQYDVIEPESNLTKAVKKTK